MIDKNDDIQQRNIDLLIAGYWYEDLPPVIDIATDTIGSGVRNLYKYTPIYSDGGKPELIEDDVFRITIPLDKVAADEGREQKTLSEREQKIYNMICENLHLSVEQVMAELDISRATVFRDYAKIKKVTGAMYDKKTSTWTLD